MRNVQKNFAKNFRNGFTLPELFIVLVAMIALGICGGILYVIGHFLAMIW